jgi:hypothetical protein
LYDFKSNLKIYLFNYLFFKSGYIPKILGLLLIIGAPFGYLLNSVIIFLIPKYTMIAIPGLVVGAGAEILLGIWLLLDVIKRPI